MQHAIQKNQPINKEIIQKLHSILRPFLLRRLKKDVEKQLPTKTEYIIKASLSRRQRYLYDEFINKENTKRSMQKQDFLGLMNILMQLKKVCNHPDLFEPRHVESPVLFPEIKLLLSAIILINGLKHSWSVVNLFTNEFSNLSFYEMDLIKRSSPKPAAEYEMLKKIDMENIGAFSRFYRKWKDIEVEERKRNFQRVYRVNKRRLDSQALLYGQSLISMLNLTNRDVKPLGIFSGFVMTIKKRINQEKSILNEFLFNIPWVVAKPPVLVTNRYNNEYEVKY